MPSTITMSPSVVPIVTIASSIEWLLPAVDHQEGSIDLDHVDRELVEVAQRGEAHPEVVERDMDAVPTELGEG